MASAVPRDAAILAGARAIPISRAMQNVLIVIHLLIVIALVGVVLLQRSEGGGLGMGSGGGGGVGGFMTGRGQANALTRATAILAGLFFITSIALAVMATHGRTQRSIIDGAPAPAGMTAPVAPSGPSAPNAGGVLDQLRQMQNQGGSQPPQPGTPTR